MLSRFCGRVIVLTGNDIPKVSDKHGYKSCQGIGNVGGYLSALRNDEVLYDRYNRPGNGGSLQVTCWN